MSPLVHAIAGFPQFSDARPTPAAISAQQSAAGLAYQIALGPDEASEPVGAMPAPLPGTQITPSSQSITRSEADR